MTAILIGVSVMYFSVSGHVYGLMLAPSAVHLKAAIIVWTFFVLVIAIATFYLLLEYGSTDVYSKATGIFNLIMIALLALPSLTILSDVFWRPALAFGEPANEESVGKDTTIPRIYDSSINPDIYYIIPDAYPNDRWLRQVLSYDNSDFSNELRARGFVVAESAQSNYSGTLHSLASTLNMQFFANNESSMRDLDYLRLSIAEAEILRHMRARGYIYVQFLSGYLLPSPFAEINRDFTPNGPVDIKIDQSGLSAAIVDGIQVTSRNTINLDSTFKQSFIPLYLDTTLLRFLSPRFNENEILYAYQQYGLIAPERFLVTVDELGAIAAMPEATFTLVHLMKPHAPLTFDAQGNFVDRTWQPSPEQFLSELGFLNMKFLQMIDTILNDSINRPVIIFQADHGSTYAEHWTDVERSANFDAYAAYHLPSPHSLSLPQSYTLINTFPLILNEVFGTEFALQDNLLFKLPNAYGAPFEQIDVTEDFLFQ